MVTTPADKCCLPEILTHAVRQQQVCSRCTLKSKIHSVLIVTKRSCRWSRAAQGVVPARWCIYPTCGAFADQLLLPLSKALRPETSQQHGHLRVCKKCELWIMERVLGSPPAGPVKNKAHARVTYQRVKVKPQVVKSCVIIKVLIASSEVFSANVNFFLCSSLRWN